MPRSRDTLPFVFAISAAVGWGCAAPAGSGAGTAPPVDDPAPAMPDAVRVPPPDTGGGGGKTVGAGGDGDDAGAADGADGDASGGDGPNVLASVCNAPACDNFESYTKGNRPGGPWTGFEVSSAGALPVDDERAFSGHKSVKVTINPGGDMRARMKHSGNGLLPAPEIYMRMMMYLDKPVKGTYPFHWNYMRVSKGSYPYIASGGDMGGKTFQLFEWSSDCYAHGNIPLPTGRWVCVEYHVNGQSDTAETYYDDKLDPSTRILNGNTPGSNAGCVPYAKRWDIPEVSTVMFGPMMYHTLGAPMAMWMDDVVVSTKRIGCPAMP